MRKINEMKRNNIDPDIKLHAEEIAEQIAKMQDQKIFQFLKKAGYETEKTEDSINETMVKLHNDGLKLVVKPVDLPFNPMTDAMNEEMYKMIWKANIKLEKLDKSEKEQYMFAMKNYPMYYHKLYKKKLFYINPGVTILVGRNGSGKTTFLRELKESLRRDNIPFFDYDNLDSVKYAAQSYLEVDNDIRKVVAATLENSEGQNVLFNLGEVAPKMGSFVKTKIRDNKKVFVIFDAIDSGLSINNIVEIKEFFNLILKDDWKDNKIFIVASANSYELARNCECLCVHDSNHVRFWDYEDYRSFIIG